MQTSKAMDEIRKIRDENSYRHLSQTPEEFSKEMKAPARWFYNMGVLAYISPAFDIINRCSYNLCKFHNGKHLK